MLQNEHRILFHLFPSIWILSYISINSIEIYYKYPQCAFKNTSSQTWIDSDNILCELAWLVIGYQRAQINVNAKLVQYTEISQRDEHMAIVTLYVY